MEKNALGENNDFRAKEKVEVEKQSFVINMLTKHFLFMALQRTSCFQGTGKGFVVTDK